jgi:hypothetical protein
MKNNNIMKCDICGKTIEPPEYLFTPIGGDKSYCPACKEKAEQEGTAS